MRDAEGGGAHVARQVAARLPAVEFVREALPLHEELLPTLALPLLQDPLHIVACDLHSGQIEISETARARRCAGLGVVRTAGLGPCLDPGRLLPLLLLGRALGGHLRPGRRGRRVPARHNRGLAAAPKMRLRAEAVVLGPRRARRLAHWLRLPLLRLLLLRLPPVLRLGLPRLLRLVILLLGLLRRIRGLRAASIWVLRVARRRDGLRRRCGRLRVLRAVTGGAIAGLGLQSGLRRRRTWACAVGPAFAGVLLSPLAISPDVVRGRDRRTRRGAACYRLRAVRRAARLGVALRRRLRSLPRAVDPALAGLLLRRPLPIRPAFLLQHQCRHGTGQLLDGLQALELLRRSSGSA